jgi:hypothetical protein
MSDDTHDQWREFNEDGPDRERRLKEIAAEPNISVRQAYYIARGEGLVKRGNAGVEEVRRMMGGQRDE